MFGKDNINKISKRIEKEKNQLIARAKKEIKEYDKQITKKSKEIQKLDKEIESKKQKEGFFKSNRACFFNEDGEFITYKSFPVDAKYFHYNGKSYVVDSTASKQKYIRNFGLRKITEYYYNINNIHPLKFETKPALTKVTFEGKERYYNVINPEGLNAMLKTKLATELNKAGGKSLSELLTPTNIIIGIVLIIIFFLLGSFLIKGG